MMIVRHAEHRDLDIYKLAGKSGVGLTSLQNMDIFRLEFHVLAIL
jgi:arginine/ornithine N-succinyltransferase beta subunit